MIELCKPEDCVGCSACTQICPKQCISMQEDHEGFLYPQIDKAVCIDCHLCEKICPVIHQASEREPLAVYAAKNKNEQIRKESSSGGIFTLLAEQIIDDGGVVFGARFDENWDVIHDHTETKEGLIAFRGSKYVQSRIDDNFSHAKVFLKAGRKVLFSGTPCQIAGLKRFLRKEYENLLTVDFVCHGVPSPKVWRLYRQSLLDDVEKNSVSATPKPRFIDIQFRNKQSGWKKYSFAATIREADQNTVSRVELFHDNIFMKGFLSDLYLRPSCHVCPAKKFKSGSNLTIADFWGIENVMPEFDDDKGISLLISNSLKCEDLLRRIDSSLHKQVVRYEMGIQNNVCAEVSVAPHRNRNTFFKNINSGKSIHSLQVLIRPQLILYIKMKLYNIIIKMGIKSFLGK